MKKILLFVFIFFLPVFCFGREINITVISKFPEDETTAIFAKLAYKDFKNNYPKSKIDFRFNFITDNWNSKNVLNAYKIALENSKYIIFTSTSTSFLKIYPNIVKKNILVFACGPTTTKISDKDDNVIRTIPDVKYEQKYIADYLNRKKITTLLILKESSVNYRYTDDALKYFQKNYSGKISIINFNGHTLKFDESIINVEKLLKLNHNIYILAGGISKQAAILINYINNFNEKKDIFLTPWIDINIIKKFSNLKSVDVFYPSYIPENQSINRLKKYILSLNKNIPYFPTSYLTYEAVKILCQSLLKVNSNNPMLVKKYILNHSFQTIFGVRKFNRFGDSYISLRFKKL